MDICNVANLIAVFASPIIAVWVGQYLQNRAEKRKDKMQIFQCLMTRRITGWAALEAVNALNSIDIIFADSEPVRNQWRILHEKYRPEISAQDQYREQCKLLELMANDLGYKDKVTWENIQNPYYPTGLDQQLKNNDTIQNAYLAFANLMQNPGLPFFTTQQQNPSNKSQEDTPHADA